MLNLVTGAPGNGKTLYAVDWLIRQIEIDKSLVKSGAVPRSFTLILRGLMLRQFVVLLVMLSSLPLRIGVQRLKGV